MDRANSIDQAIEKTSHADNLLAIGVHRVAAFTGVLGDDVLTTAIL